MRTPSRKTFRKPEQKKRLESTTYQKTFDSFEKGMQDLINTSEPIYDLLETTKTDYLKQDEAIIAITTLACEHTPNPLNKNFMHFDFRISASNCKVVTDKFYAFGWIVRWNKEKQSMEFTFRIEIMGKGEMQDSMKKDFDNAGWGIYVSPTKLIVDDNKNDESETPANEAIEEVEEIVSEAEK